MQSICKHTILLAFLCLAFIGHAQKGITTFGFSYKPMISGSLLNEGDPISVENNIEYKTEKIFGYSAGMIIRHGFSDLFSIETGINFTKRNFELGVTDLGGTYNFNQEFGVVAYGLPIQGLVYVQLSKQIYMDASFGAVLEMYPSDVAVFSQDGQVIMEGKRKSWMQGALTANIGWEWRTEKHGAFYIGATYHRTFGDAYGFLMEYDNDPGGANSNPTTILNTVNGNFLTVDFRYFFHVNVEEQLEKRKERKQKRQRQKARN